MPTGINCTQLLPVLAVWFGGGYVAGTKERAGDPTALWKAGAGPFVFVAANYRCADALAGKTRRKSC